jgi:tetratricopeptide (TPR) repeat protein
MKSERRHELQHNLLDEEIMQVWKFLQKYLTHILTGIAAILLLLVIIYWWRSAAQSTFNRQYGEYSRLAVNAGGNVPLDQRIQGLDELAQSASYPRLAVLSRLALGDACRQAAIISQAPNEQANFRNRARDAYQAALNDRNADPLQRANAHFGLAKVAEGQGEFDSAREHYDQILQMSDLQNLPVYQFAQRERQGLERRSQPVLLAEKAPYEPAPSEMLETAVSFVQYVLDGRQVELQSLIHPAARGRRFSWTIAGDPNVVADRGRAGEVQAMVLTEPVLGPEQTPSRFVVNLALDEDREHWLVYDASLKDANEAVADFDLFAQQLPESKLVRPLPEGPTLDTDLPEPNRPASD